jgi:6-phosphogluconate dehydrogenase (decarboxylating)
LPTIVDAAKDWRSRRRESTSTTPRTGSLIVASRGGVGAAGSHRSVIASWLLDLIATSLIQDPALSKFSGRVSDSGEGRWTIKAAIDEGVPAHVLSSALYERFSSRGEADFADKLLSAMRYQFGGHIEKPSAKRAG